MKAVEKNLLLEEIPLFANLTPEEHNIIREKASIIECKKEEIVYEEGSAPCAFYCLLVGRIVIFTKDAFGNKTVLEYLHRGKYFGIISILTEEPHSVTAQAINDSLLLVIKKEDFSFILNRIPALAIDLSRTLSRRLKRKDIHQKTIFESTIISVFSSYSHAGKSMYALNLALSLYKETKKSAIIIDIAPFDKAHTLPQRLGTQAVTVIDLSGQGGADNSTLARGFILRDKSGIDIICCHYNPQDESCVRNTIALLSLLVNDYHYLILDLPALMDRIIFSILNQSDLIHILTNSEPVNLRRTRHLIERLRSKFNFHDEKIKVIVNEYKLSKIEHEEKIEILERCIFATLPRIDFESGSRIVLDDPECEYSMAIRRIARLLGECNVGLVLGVGVGYGFCHIGVLKVIEEEKIPIDVIAGSSIGALIASLWVTGKSSAEILQITKEFKEPKHIWGLIDLTLPFSGFLKGNKLRRFIKHHLGNKTFEDVRIPLKIIASDVKKKEPKMLDRGLLVDAIMASCSMPGVFAPFKLKEQMLFDGGVTYPLPTEALAKGGVRKIIAVNVTPSREDIMRQYEKIKQEMAGAQPQDVKERKVSGLKNYFKSIFKINILDIIFSSVEILQSEVANKEAQLADVVLHPDTSGLYWLELHRADEFAKRGEEEARRQLDKIRQIINE